MNELKENVEGIETALNTHIDLECEYRVYKLGLNINNNSVVLNIFNNDELEETYKIEINENKTDIKSLLQSIIDFIYENEINSRQNYVNKTKAFNSRKIKSMALWMGRGKLDKVTKINEELVERYNTKTKLQNELYYYKEFSRDFYNCLTELCPTWKIEQIGEFLESEFEIYSMDVDVDINADSTIEVYYKNLNFSVAVDSFSRKNDVFRELHNKFILAPSNEVD